MSETEDGMTLDEYRGRVLRDAETHGRVVKLTGPQSVSDPSPHAHGVPVEGCVWCDLDTATAVPEAKTESLSLGSMGEPMSAERLAEIREDVETSAWGAEVELLAEVDRLQAGLRSIIAVATEANNALDSEGKFSRAAWDAIAAAESLIPEPASGHQQPRTGAVSDDQVSDGETGTEQAEDAGGRA